MAFTKATMVGLWGRISIEGLSGSGKTTTSLKIAQGLIKTMPGKRIRAICTERGRLRLESRWCDFDIEELAPDQTDPEHFVRAIREAAKDGLTGVLLTDSMSAEWNTVLQIKDAQDAKQKFTGWAKVNPRHDAVTEAILSFPGHTISSFRAKIKHEIGEDKEVKRLGAEPIARPGSEYDYDLSFFVDLNHTLTLTKPARGVYSEAFPLHWTKKMPGLEIGELITSCLEGLPTAPTVEPKLTLAEATNMAVSGGTMSPTAVKSEMVRLGKVLGADKCSKLAGGVKPKTFADQAAFVKKMQAEESRLAGLTFADLDKALTNVHPDDRQPIIDKAFGQDFVIVEGEKAKPVSGDLDVMQLDHALEMVAGYVALPDQDPNNGEETQGLADPGQEGE